MSQIEHTEDKRAKSAPRRAGRPKFVPTEEQRHFVLWMAGFKMTHEDICRVVRHPTTNKPISANTLEKAFAEELATAKTRVVELILSKYHEALQRGERWAVEFGLTRYLGFQEAASTTVSISGNGAPNAEVSGIRVEFRTPDPKLHQDDPLPPGGQYDPRVGPRPISRREMYDAANTAFPHRIEGKKA